MAVRHRLVGRSPQEVWDVLADASRYGEWVVGTSATRSLDGNWPDVGSALGYTVSFGPLHARGRTMVRRSRPPAELELEADSGWLGTARIALTVRPWGRDALLTVDEHPLRGPGGSLHNGLVDAAIQLRHRSMLGRLARVIEEDTAREHSG